MIALIGVIPPTVLLEFTFIRSSAWLGRVLLRTKVLFLEKDYEDEVHQEQKLK